MHNSDCAKNSSLSDLASLIVNILLDTRSKGKVITEK